LNFYENLEENQNKISNIGKKNLFNINDYKKEKKKGSKIKKEKKTNLKKIKNINKNQSNLNNINGLDLSIISTKYKENEPHLINIDDKVNFSNDLNNISNKISKNEIDKDTKNNNLKKIFNVTLIDGENGDDGEYFLKHYNSNNNNEVKVLKNNKIVYVNTSLLNSYYTYKNLKIVDKAPVVGRSKRSSKYRGVSKNGNQWQVLIMLNKNKSYIRSYSSEYIAARVYDILAIKSKGIKARTNFIYDHALINKIIEMNIDIKAKNINEIIYDLFGYGPKLLI
jgi:hypothetical protein